LILRVRAILRRTKPQEHKSSEPQALSPEAFSRSANKSEQYRTVKSERRLVVSGYTLDTQTYELFTPGKEKILLTPVQFDLLYHLMSHPGEIFSPARLLDEVWDYPSDTGSPDLVRVHVKNLRKRIEHDPGTPSFIRTIPGYGYTVNPGDDEEEN